MNKKRISAIWGIFAIAVVLAVVIVVYRNNLNTSDDKYIASSKEGDVTRYEWMKMLCEQEGLKEYKEKVPYFSDVEQNNPYFIYIQSAVEWEVLDDESAEFDGDDTASGRFIVLTAMKTLGESKLENFLDMEKSLTEDDYIALAIENGVIEEKQLSEGFSAEACEQVLETLMRLRFGEFWKDDFTEVVYRDGVVELPAEDVRQKDADHLEIVVGENVAASLEPGVIVVFEKENTKCKIAGKVTGIEENGVLQLASVELDEVVESLVVSDITEMTFDNIVDYYGLKENREETNNLTYQQTVMDVSKIAVFSAGVSSKGYKLSLYTEEKEGEKSLKIQITDNGTGVSYVLPISEKIKQEDEYAAEINIDRMYIGGQVSYSAWNGLEYAEAAVDVSAALKGMVSLKEEKKILLCKAPVPLGNGVIGADVQIYLVLSIEGGISFEVKLPVELSVSYEKDKGLRNFKHHISAEDPMIKANCSADVTLRIEPTLIVLGCLTVMDMEADTGVTAGAEMIERPNEQICMDVSAAFPIITLSVCGDDDMDTVIGDMGLSAEWKIIEEEDAPFQIGLHYEIFPDRTGQFVEQCTYEKLKERGEKTKENIREDILYNTYHTRYGEMNQTESPVFCFDYSDDWSITKEEVNGNSEYFAEYAEEIVELTNERGIKIIFIKFDPELFELGGRGNFYAEYEAEKVADVVFSPSNADDAVPENFVVVKLKEVGSMITDADDGIQSVNNEYFSYAVMQKNDIEKYDGRLAAMGAHIGYYDMISFEYPTPYVFFAESPDGYFSGEEENEVIAILSSLRIADDKTGMMVED